MVRRAAAFVLGLAFLAAAASAVHAIGTPAQEPPWAYGFDKGPAYDEPAPPPQNPPTRALRTAEPIDNQLRPRHLEGSLLTFSLLQTRDAHNVVDWFPGDHPSPMPRVVETDFVPKTRIAGNAFVPIERSSADRTNRRPNHRSVERRPEYLRGRARKPARRMDRVCAPGECGKRP